MRRIYISPRSNPEEWYEYVEEAARRARREHEDARRRMESEQEYGDSVSYGQRSANHR